jgi:gluconolactonase
VEVLLEGLGHPEGPDLLPDGRIVFANTYFQETAVWERNRPKQTYAHTGGAPNACVYGTDGCVYVAQCPSVGEWVAPEARPPSIQRISPTGSVDTIVTEADGIPLTAPNDLTFGPDGRLYFTDSGVWDPATRPDRGYLCVVEPDGACHVLEQLEAVYPNGIVAEPNGSIVWVESYTRNVLRRNVLGEIELLHTFPQEHIPDGMKLDADGNLWIATCGSAGIDVLSPGGKQVDFVETGGVPLNCVFDGASLIVCDNGNTGTSAEAPTTGRLLKVHVAAEGMPRYRGQIKHRARETEATQDDGSNE